MQCIWLFGRPNREGGNVTGNAYENNNYRLLGCCGWWLTVEDQKYYACEVDHKIIVPADNQCSNCLRSIEPRRHDFGKVETDTITVKVAKIPGWGRFQWILPLFLAAFLVSCAAP